jgi:capsular exopolysaccharide synthesis family protein
MQSPLIYYARMLRRWLWLLVAGSLLCAVGTYGVSKVLPPTYQASAVLIVNLKSSTSAYDNISASQLAATTYASLLTSSELLKPVVEKHPGLTLEQLSAMTSAKVQSNTSLISVTVSNSRPALAAELANEICESFADYANAQLRYASSQPVDSVQIVPAERPVDPIRPKPSLYGAIGGLVGLGLALALIFLLEWLDDRPASSDEVRDLLDQEILTHLPRLSRRQLAVEREEVPLLAEAYRRLCACLNAAQARSPFKLLMVASSLGGEGRSEVVTQLALFLAMTGKRVLLVDADMRRPELHRRFAAGEEVGPNTFLECWEQFEGQGTTLETTLPTLRVLAASVQPARPVELLQAPRVAQVFQRFEASPFDYVLFDSSPLLPVADAQVLAMRVDACLLVVDQARVSRRGLRRARSLLASTGVRCVGLVLNRCRQTEADEGAGQQYLRKTRVVRSASQADEAVEKDAPVPVDAASPASESRQEARLLIASSTSPLEDDAEDDVLTVRLPALGRCRGHIDAQEEQH